MENKTEFKKGDEVVMLLKMMGNISIIKTTIKNITPKGIIKTDNNYTFTSDGIYKSTERFNTTFGCIIHYNDEGKNIIAGKKHISNILNISQNVSVTAKNIYSKIYDTHQCDTEKLESIINRLNDIQNELSEMVNNK